VEGFVATIRLELCSACRLAYYCSKKCQVADWPRHKPVCRASAQQTVDALAALGAANARTSTVVFWPRNPLFDPSAAIAAALALEYEYSSSPPVAIHTLVTRRQALQVSFFFIPNDAIFSLATRLRKHLALGLRRSSTELILASESSGRRILDDPLARFRGPALSVESTEKVEIVRMDWQ
jgi:hypothetical protein